MKARLLLTGCAFLFSTHVAQAQGLRLEIQDSRGHDASRNRAVPGEPVGNHFNGRISVGVDFSLGHGLLLGVDGEYSDSAQKRTTRSTSEFGRLTSRVEDGPNLYVGARASRSLSSHFLLYGGAGYTRTSYDSSFTFAFSSGQVVGPIDTSATEQGYRLSAGGQLRIGRRTFLETEYRYSDFGNYFIREQIVARIGIRF